MTQATQNLGRGIESKAKSNNILGLVLGIITLIIGIALLANPAVGMEVILLILGIVMIAYGAMNIIMDAARGIKGAGIYFMPALILALGILLIVFRGFAANILLPLVVGVWAVVNGIMNLVSANRKRQDGGYWQPSFILALISLILGVVMIIAMIAGGNAVGAILGVILIIFSIVSIIQWFIERSARHSAT